MARKDSDSKAKGKGKATSKDKAVKQGFLQRNWAWMAAVVAGFGLVFTVMIFLGKVPSGFIPHDRHDAAEQAPAVTAPLAETPPPAAPQPEAALPAVPQGDAGERTQGAQQYEEAPASGFEEELKRIDYAILQTLRQFGLGPDSYGLMEVSQQHDEDLDYLVQSISIQFAKGPEQFADALRGHLTKWAPDAAVTLKGADTLNVALFGRETHNLRFESMDAPPPPPRPSGSGVLAIVIDDLGENVSFAEALARLPYPVTFAVWPQASHTRAVAQIGKKHGLDVIIHQPMEPDNYPRINPGPGVILTRMSDEEITRVLQKNIALVPEAIGINNHMGSKFTASTRGMRLVMGVLKEKGLFFLDSRTNARSAARAAAAEFGVPFVGRHVFLDNIAEENAVFHQLKKAESMALKNGIAVAIGHPHSATMAALRRFSQEAAPGLRMVSVASLTRDASRKNVAARQ